MHSPASSGRPGPGLMSTPSGSSSIDLVEGQRVAAVHERLGAQLAQVLDEVVDERVVVVDDQHARAPCAGQAIGPGRATASRFPRYISRAVANEPKRPQKRRVEGSGRVTPKGGPAKAPKSSRSTAPDPSGRYTPPVPSYKKVSPPWWPATMFVPWALGIVVIILELRVAAARGGQQLVRARRPVA